MDNADRAAYESPLVLEVFEAHEVMGAAEGFIGNGSIVATPA